MATPLFPTFEKRVSDSVEALIATQVTPWSFLTAGPPFRVKRFDGREISYQGVLFAGSPRDVFWRNYIEPFLEDLVLRELAFAVVQCKERKVDTSVALPELQGLLLSGCHKVFARMADIDRRLRGQGNPQKMPIRPIESELNLLKEFIYSHVSAELTMCKPRPFENWFDRNKFWVWIVGSPVSIAGLLITVWLAQRQKHQETPRAATTQQIAESPTTTQPPPRAASFSQSEALRIAITAEANKGGAVQSNKEQNIKQGSTNGSMKRVDPSIIENKKDIIDKKKEAWVKDHAGIIARHKLGKTDKSEIETAIHELELIEQLAADIDDHRSKNWADQEKLQLQMIDVPPLR